VVKAIIGEAVGAMKSGWAQQELSWSQTNVIPFRNQSPPEQPGRETIAVLAFRFALPLLTVIVAVLAATAGWLGVQLTIGLLSGLFLGAAVFSHLFSRAVIMGLIAGAILGIIMVDGVEGYVKWASYLPAEMIKLAAFWIGLAIGVVVGARAVIDGVARKICEVLIGRRVKS
jgi:Na+/proline symporter